jgi:hypothetical protein
MTDLVATPGDGTSGTALSPTPPDASGICLDPAARFPADLAALSLVELQVLHSRICRQLDREYLIDPAGPHPLTLDRHCELGIELARREGMPHRS